MVAIEETAHSRFLPDKPAKVGTDMTNDDGPARSPQESERWMISVEIQIRQSGFMIQ